jgi:hypothetical protein
VGDSGSLPGTDGARAGPILSSIAARPLSSNASGTMVTTQKPPMNMYDWRQPTAAIVCSRIDGQSAPAR